MTCLEARAGVVELTAPKPGAGPDAPASLLSFVGPWNGDGSAPILEGDRVVAAALESRLPVRAADVADAGPGDADMAAPLLDRRGQPFGVLAVRGLPHRAAGEIALRDLAVAGGWLANVLTPPPAVNGALARGATGDDDGQPYLDLSLSYDTAAKAQIAAEVQS